MTSHTSRRALYAAHCRVMASALRAKVIARLGEGGYKILYTLVSFAGLGLIVWGFSIYRATGWINVWYPPVALRHLVLALMLPWGDEVQD